MNTVLKQLSQWPPTGSTVIGAGMLIGLAMWYATGSLEGAVALAGMFKILCPQDAGATDQVLDALRRVTIRPAAMLVCCLGLAFALSACTGGAANTGNKVADVITSPAGASLLSQINTGFAPPVQKVLDKVNSGLAVAESDKKYVCGAMSMLDGLFSVASSVGLVKGANVATEGTAMVAVNGVCGSSVGDLKSAVNTVANTYVATTAALNAAGVPVAAVRP